MTTMQRNIDVTEEQSSLIATTLCLPFEYASVFVTVEYEWHKGWGGSQLEPPEPEEVEINVCYITELYDVNGNVCNLSFTQSKLLDKFVCALVNPLELEVKCFEHHYEEERECIEDKASTYYEENNTRTLNE
jgi:hypothetical protein